MEKRFLQRNMALPILFTFHFSFFLSSCQSDSYQVNGFAHQLLEGDTIFVAHGSEPENPFAMTTVKGGKFWFEGSVDETIPCCVYLKRQPACSAVFFPDQGTISVELNLPPTPSRISGTCLNNEWQQMNDAIQQMGTKLIGIVARQDSDSTIHLARLKAVDSLHREMSGLIVNTGQRNRDNPLGRFILENYKEPEFK